MNAQRLAFAVSLAGLLAPDAFPQESAEREIAAIETDYEEGRYVEARRAAEAFVERYPENEWGWTLLGHCCEELDDDPAARRAYEKALAIQPDEFRALVGMGILCRKAGDYDEAMGYYERAVAIDATHADAWSSMAVIELKREHDRRALELALKAYELAPDDPVIAANLAVAYHYNGDVENRDRMAEQARRNGYRNMESLRQIFSGELAVRDPYRLYREQGRSWVVESTARKGGEVVSVDLVAFEVVEVTEQGARVSRTLVDEEHEPLEGLSPTVQGIEFAGDLDASLLAPNARIVRESEETIETRAGAFECRHVEALLAPEFHAFEGEMRLEYWISRRYPGLVVRATRSVDDRAWEEELVSLEP